MNHSTRLVASLVIVLGLFALWPKAKHNSSELSSNLRQNAGHTAKTSTRNNSVKKAAEAQQVQPSGRAPANSTANSSALEDMSRTLFQFSRPSSDIKSLVDYLEQTRQEPMVVRDANPYSGEMAIVRTKSPLPGTRYFHAQYFADENGKGFVQHMSFEFKPGPDAMNEAVKSVQRQFSLSEPKVRRADYAKWDLKEGYVLWVKKMDTPDLQDDPFNAYTPADKGTIRVAIEAEIH